MVSTSSSRISSGSTLMAEKAACGWKVLATLAQKGEIDHQSHTILSRGVKVSCTGDVSKIRFGESQSCSVAIRFPGSSPDPCSGTKGRGRRDCQAVSKYTESP